MIAFPKSGGGVDPLTAAPAPITAEQRKEAGVDAVPTEDLPRHGESDPPEALGAAARDPICYSAERAICRLVNWFTVSGVARPAMFAASGSV